MIVFLYGKDAYRVKQNTDKIVGEYLAKHPAGVGVLRTDLTEAEGFNQLEETVKTVGLFAEKKLVVVKNAFAESEKVLGLIKGWKLLEDKERIIVMVENGSAAELKKKDNKLFALLTAKPNVAKEFRPLAGKQLADWLAREAAGLGMKLELAAASALLAAASNDCWRLSLELTKLANYIGQANTIRLADVNALVAKPLEQNIFNTIDALGARDRRRAITLLARHLAEGEDPYYLFTMFVYQFRNLLLVKTAGAKPPPGLHPYVARKLAGQARQFELAELKQKFSQLATADLAIKRGQVDIIDWLYQFALS